MTVKLLGQVTTHILIFIDITDNDDWGFFQTSTLEMVTLWTLATN